MRDLAIIGFFLFAVLPGMLCIVFWAVTGRIETQDLGFLLPVTLFFVLLGSGIRSGMRNAEREFRQRNHLCLNCGYNLRQSPDRCPECGTPVTLV